MSKTTKTRVVRCAPFKCAFGKLINVTDNYNIDRGNETHTKIIDIPSPFHGKLTVDDVLEPSEYILLEFKGIHNSYYMGINYVKFYDGEGKKIEYENVEVDGQRVDNTNIIPAMPTDGWWAIAGEEHSLLFRFKNLKQHVQAVDIMCANASATPKYLHVSDGKSPANVDESSFHEDCVFQLAGEEGKDPSELKFLIEPNSKEKISFSDVIAKFNKNAPPNGFNSVLSSCEKFLFVFYRQGLRTRALNYYFGKKPTRAFNLAASVSITSSGKSIKKAEHRAMTLEELQAVRAVIISNCIKDKWKSSVNGNLIRPDDVNLYDLNAELIKPLTKKRNCAFKELFLSSPSSPTFYISHWWGEGFLDFIRCCEYHAHMHGLAANKVKYWVCAFANRQQDLGEDLGTNPDESSFRQAMAAAQGVVLVLDSAAVVYGRIWVDFELYKTFTSKHCSIDMVTHNSGEVHILAAKPLHGEGPYQRICREQHFPYSQVCKTGLTVELQDGETSMQIDKIRILNIMVEKENLDDKKTLKLLKDSKRMSNEDFLKDSIIYEKGNNAIRGELALKCFPAALMTEGHSLNNFHGHNLVDIVAKDNARTKLKIELLSLETVTDTVLKQIVGLINSNILDCHLNFVGCQNLTDDSLEAMKLPDSLKKLHLGLGISKQITNEGVIALAGNMPRNLTTLSLDVRAHKKSDGSFSPARRNDHLNAIGKSLPGNLIELKLKTNLDRSEDGSGLVRLTKELPRGLKKLSISFEVWSGFNGKYLTNMAVDLPESLESLIIYCWGGNYWESTDIGKFAIQIMKLKFLKDISVCTSDNGESGYYRTRKLKSMVDFAKYAGKQ